MTDKADTTEDARSNDGMSPSRFQWLHRCVAFFLLLFAGLTLSGLPWLTFDDDLKSLFRGESQAFRDYQKYSELFGSKDDECVVLLTCRDLYQPDSLQAIREVDTALHDIDQVQDINSLCHLLAPKRVGRILLPTLPFSGAAEDTWNKAAEELKQHPMGVDNLYTRNGKHALITFRLRESISDQEKAAAIQAVENVLAVHWGKRQADANDEDEPVYGLTGIPILRTEVTRNLQRDQQKFTWLGLLFAIVIGWFLFRKPVPVVFVAAVPFLGLGCIMGILGWLNVPLNIVNNVITPLVLVIGFAEVIHILFLTGGFIGDGMDHREAVTKMIRQLFLPCLLAALTTAIGFGSLYMSTDQSLREFAIVASVSSLVMFVMVLATSGCLLATPIAKYCVRLPRKIDPASLQQSIGVESNQPRVDRSYFRLALLVSAIAVILTGVAAKIASKNHSDYRFTENLPENNLAVTTLHVLDREFGGSSSEQLIVEFEQKPTPIELMATLREIKSEVEGVENVGQTTSLLELLHSLPPQPGTDAQHFRELKFMPRQSWERFLKLKPTQAQMQLKLPDLGSNELMPVLQEVEQKLKQVEASREGISTTLTGLNVLAVRRSQQMIGDLTKSLMGASVAIFLLIMIVYRSIPFAIAAIIVNAFPILGVAAVMSWMEQPIQYTGIMLLCVCLGLAVDDTVHFLSKFKLLLAENVEYEQAVRETISRLWPVFVTTSLMLGVGFGLAATSEIPTFQTFGGYACVALFLALVADLVFLPSLLICLHQLFKRST